MNQAASPVAVLGRRVQRLRLATGRSQAEIAEIAGVASGLVSMIEQGRSRPTVPALRGIATGLGCAVEYLQELREEPRISAGPWLRAYADAPQRSLERELADIRTVADVTAKLTLKRLPDITPIPLADDDPLAFDDVEAIATEARVLAGIADGAPVRNCMRAAERLGCILLPMREEMGRHLGVSVRINGTPVIAISRSAELPEDNVPGDRQRFTVAHELGHLSLHADTGTPVDAEAARRIEKQAHRFAAAFLAPGDSMMEELHTQLRGRVTLGGLAQIKSKWGVSIKALVSRFRDLGVVDEYQARSLYKQISARGWNKAEPVSVPNEQGQWLTKALGLMSDRSSPNGIRRASAESGLDRSHINRWLDWSPVPAPALASVIPFAPRK